jgi:hypothetical protein
MSCPSYLTAERGHGFQALAILLLVCLAACQREGIPAPAPVTAAPPPPPAADAPKNADALSPIVFTVEPSRMETCDPAVEADIRWDAAAIPAATTVEIWVSDGTEFKLFVAGGAQGEAKTGPWTRPGAKFQARNPSSKQVLAELQIAGPQCQ